MKSISVVFISTFIQNCVYWIDQLWQTEAIASRMMALFQQHQRLGEVYSSLALDIKHP